MCLCVRVCVCVPDYLALAAACITANARAVKSVEELGDEKREREKEREREERERRTRERIFGQEEVQLSRPYMNIYT